MPQCNTTKVTREALHRLDAADPLAALRRAFDLGSARYFNGNSLGPPPLCTRKRLREVVDAEWGTDLIRSWNVHDWITLPERVGDKIAALIGAAPGEVVVGDSTSVCLFKLIAMALNSSRRTQIITDENNFPTDLYILSGLQQLLGERIDLQVLPPDRICAAISEQTALVALTHIEYKNSRMYDMPAVSAAARAKGALILWDLSHSVGAVPLALNDCGVDLAVGCTYKFLNGGPGSPAFSFVARRHQESLQPVLRGWMGHAAPFQFSPAYVPAPGIRRLLAGASEVLALSSINASLDVFAALDMDAVRAKSLDMSGLLMQLIEQECAGHDFVVATPRAPEQRGSHVAVRHPQGYAIMQALIARNFIGDFRAPDVMRFAITPIYQRYMDIWDLVSALRKIMETREWDCKKYSYKTAVT